MRQIGTLPNEGQARTFGDHLYVKKIENTVQEEDGGVWSVWIHHDNFLDVGMELLSRFKKDPGNPEFQSAPLKAKFQRARAKKDELLSRNKTVDVRTQWHLKSMGMGRLTLSLILISVGVALISQLGVFALRYGHLLFLPHVGSDVGNHRELQLFILLCQSSLFQPLHHRIGVFNSVPEAAAANIGVNKNLPIRHAQISKQDVELFGKIYIYWSRSNNRVVIRKHSRADFLVVFLRSRTKN